MRTLSKISWVAVAAIALSLAVPVTVQADSGSDSSKISHDLQKQLQKAVQDAKKQESQQKKLLADFKHLQNDKPKKLSKAKLKTCQKRQRNIVKKMDQLIRRNDKQLAYLDAVSSQLQQLVTAKQLTPANYTEILAAVNARRATVQASLDNMQVIKATFNCVNGDPKDAAATYTTTLRTANLALKDYRDSVKQLLLSVKSAVRAKRAGILTPVPVTPVTPTPTPSPVTITPTPNPVAAQ